MPRPSIAEDRLLRLGGVLTGAVLLAAAVLAADLAREHMRVLGTLCGADPTPHCGWCLLAASLVIAGLAAFIAAFGRPRRLARRRA